MKIMLWCCEPAVSLAGLWDYYCHVLQCNRSDLKLVGLAYSWIKSIDLHQRPMQLCASPVHLIPQKHVSQQQCIGYDRLWILKVQHELIWLQQQMHTLLADIFSFIASFPLPTFLPPSLAHTHPSGCFQEHTMEFKRIRDAHISESAAETNRLVIRLEKVERHTSV